jgi:hypothetical protein
MPVSAERQIANRVAKKLAGGGERHRRAEERRDCICRLFHFETSHGRTIGGALNIIGIMLAISASTVRSIHTRHCRRVGK